MDLEKRREKSTFDEVHIPMHEYSWEEKKKSEPVVYPEGQVSVNIPICLSVTLFVLFCLYIISQNPTAYKAFYFGRLT